MRSKALIDLLGIVAMLAGVAVLAFSSCRLLEWLGGAALVCGLGAAAWSRGGMSLFKKYVVVLLITALIVGALVVAKLVFGR